MLAFADADPERMSWIWYAIGFLGQALFFARFLVQWLASERARRSVFPVAFWYFSVAGGLILLVYAIRIGDPVFITGQAFGMIVYTRNLYFRGLEKKRAGRD